ncbi:hypothetical protein BHE74_00048395 [Ensete ventricosum]|nr:hypothetical protein BHE74_00048395 [Ensete ventricosum]
MVSLTSMVSQKNATVINFARSCMQSRVSIDFSCTVSEISETVHEKPIETRLSARLVQILWPSFLS